MFKFKFKPFNGLVPLYLRECKLWLGAKWAIPSSLIVPLLYLFLLGTGMKGMIGQIPFTGDVTYDYVLFIAPSIIGMSIVSTAITAGGHMLWYDRRHWGMLEEILTLPVSRTSYILAKVLWVMTLSICQLLFVLFIGTLLIEGFECANIFLILISIFLGVVCFCSLVIPFASLIDEREEFSTLSDFIPFPLIFCSSAFYPLEAMPSWLRTIAYMNPMTYMVKIARAGFIGIGSWNQIFLEILILCVFTIFFFVMSNISLKKVRV